MTGGALFSPCRTWRYNLWRRWDTMPAAGFCNFLMLNGSDVNEEENDPTVSRCIIRAKEYGFGGLIVTNIFGLVSTDPRNLKLVPDPVGPGNDHAIIAAAATCSMVVCAWGSHGKLFGRSHRVLADLRRINAPLHALAFNMDGSPVHPLYRKYSEVPSPWK